jgi:thiopeptide-type bacteriocin biosynthesis protein
MSPPWTSAHIAYGDDLYGPDVDRLLVAAVAPRVDRLLASGRIERFFFVRYADPESHLRLRLQPAPGTTREELAAEVREMVEAFADSHGTEAPPRLWWVDYVPENQRYGGQAGVRVAERHFALSSRLALEILSQTQGKVSLRWGKALFMAVLLARGLLGGWQPALAFLRRYAESYLDTLAPAGADVETWKERLRETARAEAGTMDAGAVDRALRSLVAASREGDELGVPLLDRWLRGCAASRRDLLALAESGRLESSVEIDRALMGLAASYLHMHHNRLGLSLPQEVYLTQLSAEALASAVDDH